MTRAAKYIIWDDGITKCAIVFNNHLTHQNMAFQLNIKPISAGFVRITGDFDLVEAYGESVSLKLKSRPEDGAIIQRMLFPGT
jgi:hypothetical protein